MNQKTYTHCEVWCLLRDYAAIDQARKSNDPMWKAFCEAVAMQTGQGYSDEWNTPTLINKMGDDMNSYSELSMLWCAIEEAFNHRRDPSVL